MIIGYARVSTNDQNLDMQIDAIEKYAAEKGEKCRIFQEKASGSEANRKELEYALSLLTKGDKFVVYKIDRLARSMQQLITSVNTVHSKEAEFISLSDDGMDTTTAGGRLLFQIMGSVAEFERNIIQERTKAGLEAARKRGRVGGRPVVSDKVKKLVRTLYAAGDSASDISKEHGIGRSTVYKILNEERGNEMDYTEKIKEMDYTEKIKEMGRHANALIALHLKKPDDFDKEWLFNKLLDQYESLGLDVDNQELEEDDEKRA